MMRIGSLFTGYGGIEFGLAQVVDCEPAWFAEIDPAASKVLAHHWPDVSNLGDVTAINWSNVEPVDVFTGGVPCQDVSHAGKRAGMRAGTRTGLWSVMRDAVNALRPPLVIFENVRGILSADADSDLEPCPGCVGDPDDGAVLRALGRVLGDLADLGYDAWWRGLRAADVGAAHNRFRVFVFAAPADTHLIGLQGFNAHPAARGAAPSPARLVPRGQDRPAGVAPVRGCDTLPRTRPRQTGTPAD